MVRNEIQEPRFQHFFVALWQAGRNMPNTFHPRSIWRQERVRPNPSVDRTSTGLARAALRLSSRCAGQSGSGPLTSNVRAHKNTVRVHGNSAKRSPCKGGSATERHNAAARWHANYAGEFSLNFRRSFAAMAARVLSFRPKVVNAWLVALHALLAQAARPLAGCSPVVALYQGHQYARFFPALRLSGRMRESPLSHAAFARSQSLIPCAIEHWNEVRPNPSVEPTRSGMAPWPRGFHVYHPPRGQGTTPPRAAHLKR